MAGKYEIIWTSRANIEFHKILEFYAIRNENPNYSLKILSKTEEILELLRENEYLGRLTSNKKTRVIVMDVYLVFYEIKDNQIYILSFWDNRQNPNNRIDNK